MVTWSLWLFFFWKLLLQSQSFFGAVCWHRQPTSQEIGARTKREPNTNCNRRWNFKFGYCRQANFCKPCHFTASFHFHFSIRPVNTSRGAMDLCVSEYRSVVNFKIRIEISVEPIWSVDVTSVDAISWWWWRVDVWIIQLIDLSLSTIHTSAFFTSRAREAWWKWFATIIW